MKEKIKSRGNGRKAKQRELNWSGVQGNFWKKI